MIHRLMFVPLVAWGAYSQTKAPDELKFSFNGAGVAIHTESSASQSPLSTSGAVVVGDDSTSYRIVLDRDNKPLFAYELELRKGPLNTVRVTIKPADREKLHALDWLKGKLAGDVPTIGAVRAFPPLRLGDEAQVDIMYNPRTGEKLSDVLRVTPEAQPAPKPGKVFTGPQFSWEGVKVAIDGKIVADRSGNWMIGEAIMMRVPGHGEYYMALQPPAGFPFQPSGRVDRNVLRFRADGEQVEITGRSNLLMKSETGTVWIYHVPEARAKGRADEVDITCSGDVDLLMHPERQKEE
jgi:hypothetical protein